jgi:hypothetical protein
MSARFVNVDWRWETEDGGREKDIQEAERDGGTGIRDNKTGAGVPAISTEGA